jgi:hypothetical protein
MREFTDEKVSKNNWLLDLVCLFPWLTHNKKDFVIQKRVEQNKVLQW